MARRKQDLAGKLSSGRKTRPGWEDTVTGQAGRQPEVRRPAFMQEEPVPEPANKLKRKTYLLYPDMIEEIEAIAEEERVGINELVRYLLGVSLDQFYNRELEIPTQPGKRRIDQ
ncbi:MAG: hypothetical protein DHS20C20_22520 [Ardenticatenaceae bacterium]|nr:MAG: hypothetical protein DHS20C20_22520 [Ardenticatenaceae bacterium]